MTKEELIGLYQEMDAEAKKQSGTGIVYLLASTVMTVAPLVKAGRHAKKGNYAAASYYLLMWHSFKMSSVHQLAAHRAKEAEKKDRSTQQWAQRNIFNQFGDFN